MLKTKKTGTDLHWNSRAASIANDIEVNIMDIFQREMEYDYVCRFLRSSMRLLEVGCGNGFSTQRFREIVEHVDAFDYSENMILRAKATFGETNNRFINDNLLEPRQITATYDAVVCVRVLINLADLAQQKLALTNMKRWLKPGGVLILVEGFRDGFEGLDRLREQVELPPIQPAKINFYSSLQELSPELSDGLTQVGQFHLGAYDYLTRVLYPLIVGHDNARHNTNFSEKCMQLARAFNPDAFQPYSRIRGLVFKKT